MSDLTNLPIRPMPRPTAQVAMFVEALGPDSAVRFLLRFGGAELYQGPISRPDGMVADFLGHAKARALADHPSTARQKRVPLARKWLSQMLAWPGHSTADIARKVRASDTSVRKWLKDAGP